MQCEKQQKLMEKNMRTTLIQTLLDMLDSYAKKKEQEANEQIEKTLLK